MSLIGEVKAAGPGPLEGQAMRKLSPAECDALRLLIARSGRRSADWRAAHRLHCMLLVAAGRSCREVAGWFGDSRRSVERWAHEFERRGSDALRPRRPDGRPPKLESSLIARLQLDLELPPVALGYSGVRWTGRLLALHLIERYDVRLGVRQCQRVLRLRRIPIAGH